MSRLFCVLLLSALVIIVLSVFIPTAAFASDHPALFDQQHTSANAPPLPFVRPQVTPLLLYNPHADIELATATEKWINVHLGEQRVTAYEGSRPVRSFIVSTGLPRTPTVTGQFRIRMKVRSQTMSGPGYYLPNEFMRRVGFNPVETCANYMTVMGTLTLLRARRPGWPDTVG
ncbi:MAG: hypothetical protein DCC55_23385 [Chloroflexi bacterium]|nr:MAG: hypothetical protein DCC55_23385 [Chloroflexota bacterium]